MEHVRVIFFFACVLTFVPYLALAQSDTYEFPPDFNCVGNLTASNAYASNLELLISSLSSLASQAYGFYNLSSADSSAERAYAIGLCRREVKRDDCLSCIKTAARTLYAECWQSTQAFVWYTHCMFRYSNRTIYGRKLTSPTKILVGGKNMPSKGDEFKHLQLQLLNRLKGIAAAGGPNRKYAQGSGFGVAEFPEMYGTAHCTPDLSEQDCNDCLVSGFEQIPGCCHIRTGLRWFCPSCNFRFETGPFYEFEADPPAIAPPESPTSAARPERAGAGKGKGGSKAIIAIIVPIVVALFVICLGLVWRWKKNKSGDRVKESNAEDEFSSSLVVDFETLQAATQNFSPENELGRGGFGSVYKGVLSDGQEIAVKRLSGTSGQGDIEFKNEILLLAKLQHRNLVRLIGYCIQGPERLLVYEFMKNTSLDYFIFDHEKRQVLDWEMRYKMIGGVARGLLYLHEDSFFRIIHRDLKASNILLDQELIPKIADFGLARLFDTNQTTTDKFTNRIAGTYGYMAPEYAMHGQFSVKTDVFSFGVLVIEIITGKRNNIGPSNDDKDAEDLLSWVWRSWREDTILNVIDPSLTTGSRNEILRCIHICLLCVQESSSSRPTMASVILMFNNDSLTLPTPSRPAFVAESVIPPSNVSSSSTEPLILSLNDVTISELFPR